MNDKMIEEMRNDIRDILKLHIDKTILYPYLAQDLYTLGYRNCKDKVVLDRQEYQKYCAYKIIEPQIKGCLDRERKLEKQIAELEEQRDRQAYIAEELIQEKHRWTEQARKETAKEILSLAIKHYNGYITDMTRFIGDLITQYGVEVEE